jgi:hypothetical protein
MHIAESLNAQAAMNVIARNQIGKRGAGEIATALRENPSLRRLSLNDMQSEGKAVKYNRKTLLSAASVLHAIAASQIGNKGGTAIAGRPWCKQVSAGSLSQGYVMHLVSCKANTNLFRYKCRSSMQSQGVIPAIVAFKRYMKHKGDVEVSYDTGCFAATYCGECHIHGSASTWHLFSPIDSTFASSKLLVPKLLIFFPYFSSIFV